MTSLLVIKEYIKSYYSKYDIYIIPVLKFILSIITFTSINASLGYMEKLNSVTIVLIASLACSVLPSNVIILAAAAFILLHLYSLAVECAVVAAVVFLILFLLYFRFTPKDTLAVLLTPLCFFFKVPYVMPIAMGLIGTPVSIASVSCGVVVYYLMKLMVDNATMLSAQDADNAMQKLKSIVDGLTGNQAMLVTLAAFALTVAVVYMIRRLSIDYAWTIAMAAGAFTSIVVMLIGELTFNLNFSIPGIILGAAAAIGITMIIQFFVLNLDYTRTENVQFEDDEYYYYVKAVPKNRVSTPEKQIKQITASKRMSGSRPAKPRAVKKRPAERK